MSGNLVCRIGTNHAYSATREFTRSHVLIIAVAVAVALALTLLAAPRASADFNVSGFSVNPSTKLAGAHPNLSVTFRRTGTNAEDLRDFKIDYAAGQLFNPESVPDKCTAMAFASDACPPTSQVGTFSVKANLEILFFSLPVTAQGAVYVLEPQGVQHALLGYVTRPSGYAKSFSKQPLYVRTDSDSGMQTVTTNIPRSQSLSFPRLWGSTNIAITQLTFNYSARSGADKSGAYFTLNPTSCDSSRTVLSATSYQGVESSRNFDWTPTSCDFVPFSPSMSIAMDDNTPGGYTGGTFEVQIPSAPATVQNSALKQVSALLPPGSGLNFSLLGSYDRGCLEEELAADACPEATMIGDASASVPFFPPDFAGEVYVMDPIGSTVQGAIVLRGPRGMKSILRFTNSVEGGGAESRIRSTWDYVPHFPFSRFVMHIAEPLIKNPACPGGPQTSAVDFTGYNGRTRTLNPVYTTGECVAPPPAPVITSPVSGSVLTDSTPTVSGAAEPGSTVTLFDDGAPVGSATADAVGAWSVTPAASIGEGASVLQASASNAGGSGPLSPEVTVTVDSVVPEPPVIVRPAEGQTITFSDVVENFTGTAEPGSKVRLYANGSPVGSVATTNASGNWNAPMFGFPIFGPVELTGTATDSAGNVSSLSPVRTFIAVDAPFVVITVTDGPRNGFNTDDRTPTWSFTGAGSHPTECSFDGGAAQPCTSPFTPADPLANGAHTLSVQVAGGPPTSVNFNVGDFAPTAQMDFSTSQAAANPDLTVTLINPYGDLHDVNLQLPTGFWASLRSVFPCTNEAADIGECPATSSVGTVAILAQDDLNAGFYAIANMHAVIPAPGDLARVSGMLDIPGKGEYRLDLILRMRYNLDDGQTINVENPKGMNNISASISNQTSTGDRLHARAIQFKFIANAPGYLVPLLYNPSSCDPAPGQVDFVSYENNTAAATLPYQPTGCETVPFEPTLTQTYSSALPNQNISTTVETTVPMGHSTIKNLVIDMPPSVIPQYAGLANSCSVLDVENSIVPNCDIATTKVGTAVIDTPLLPSFLPLSGDVYLEDSGGTLPYLHIRLYQTFLGIEIRIRAMVETVSSPSHLRVSANTYSDSTPANIADLPFTSLTLNLPGTTANGPITKLSSQCRKSDTSTATLGAWSGATVAITQGFTFDPACPK